MKNVSTTILSELNYLPKIKAKKDHKIGIIGTGRIALRRQIPAYQHTGLNVVAVADIKQDALDQARKLYGIERACLDFYQLLDQKDIDIVDICTNTFPRKQITLDALKAGNHVLSEKPFARSIADALEMVQAADRASVKFAIHQPTRWYYPCAVARQLIMKDFLGDIFYNENFKSKMAVSATARFDSGIVAAFSLNQATRFFHLPYTVS
jgi:predicted dehydrogenase